VRTINRRRLNHDLARVLDAVIETREPIRVEGRDGRAVVISPDTEKESEWDRWNRLGLIRPAQSKPDTAFWARWKGRPTPDVDSDWLLAEMAEDH
jgi:PHD/YefM family antitoxin component YafN of YafNO toxin-antitoxin module